MKLCSNVTLRDFAMRAPEGTAVGRVRGVSISNVAVSGADPQHASIISGVPGSDVEGFAVHGSQPVGDAVAPKAERKEM